MKNPGPVNLQTKAEVSQAGWAAEARDSDGHLCSVVGWMADGDRNENADSLANFIIDYASDMTITIFPENITEPEVAP